MRLTTTSRSSPSSNDLAGRAVLEVGQQPQDVLLPLERNLAALGAQALAQQGPERRGVDELDLAAPLGPFPVREHPDVGGDARVVEELLGQCYQRFEQIVLENPAANLTLTAAGVAGEERRPVHDDRHPRTALGGLLDVREHVLQEQELPVADPRQARPEAPGCAPVVLVLYGVVIALPVLAVGWIGDHVIEGASAACRSFESVLPKRMFSASRPSSDFMKRSDLQMAKVSGFTSWPNRWVSASGIHGIAAAFAVTYLAGGDVLLGDGEHAARAAARVVDAEHDPLRGAAAARRRPAAGRP